MTIPSDLPNNPPAEQPHKPADDREEIYYAGSPLLRGDLGRAVFLWIIGLALIIVPFFFTLPSWVYAVTCIIGVIFLLIPWVLTRTIRYRISNYRIDFERGLLSRSIDTLELWHVEDISFHQSLLDRILGVGTITVISHDDTNPKLELRSVPNPRPLFDSLKQRIISVKRQRGVIKMDMG